MLLVNS